MANKAFDARMVGVATTTMNPVPPCPRKPAPSVSSDLRDPKDIRDGKHVITGLSKLARAMWLWDNMDRDNLQAAGSSGSSV